MNKELSVITGKRVMLFSMEYESDLAYMDKLLTPETKALILGYPPPMTPDSIGWIIKTMQGKASKTVGILCITPIAVMTVVCQAIIDPIYAAGLEKRVADKKPTYVEEALRLLSDSILGNGYMLSRIEIGVVTGDELSESLFRNAGFEKEGILRKGCIKDNSLCDLIIMSRVKDINLKEDENGKEVLVEDTETAEKHQEGGGIEKTTSGGRHNDSTIR